MTDHHSWHQESAARAAARDEAARIWAERLAPKPPPPTHCAGPCDQGRRLCPCPVACGRDADDAGPLTWRDFWDDTPIAGRIAGYIVAAITIVAAAWHVAARWL